MKTKHYLCRLPLWAALAFSATPVAAADGVQAERERWALHARGGEAGAAAPAACAAANGVAWRARSRKLPAPACATSAVLIWAAEAEALAATPPAPASSTGAVCGQKLDCAWLDAACRLMLMVVP